MTPTDPSSTHPPDRDLRRTYTAVVLVEIAVVAALWWFGRYFGG